MNSQKLSCKRNGKAYRDNTYIKKSVQTVMISNITQYLKTHNAIITYSSCFEVKIVDVL